MKNNHLDQCPSAHEFTQYLSGKGSNMFRQRFEHHLTQCPLCADAVQGYRFMAATPVDIQHPNPYRNRTIRWQSAVSIAASVVLLIGIGLVATKLSTNPATPQPLAFSEPDWNLAPTPVKSDKGVKRLQANGSTAYLFVGADNQINLNDCRIAQSEVDKAMAQFKQKSEVMVEVETENTSQVNTLVNRIKTESGVNVYTFSKTRGIKTN